MLGLLARVVIGIAVAGAIGEKVYAVYKLITKDTVKEEVKQKLLAEDSSFFQKAFSAKVKEKSQNNEVVKVDVLDSWDEPLTEVSIYGDEISGDIKVGDIIRLKDVY